MRLTCLAGAYAGQIRDYSPIAGLAALKAGTATRAGDVGPVRAAPVATSPMPSASAAPASMGKRKK